MENTQNKRCFSSQKQEEFDANFQDASKIFVASSKQKEFDANFVEEE